MSTMVISSKSASPQKALQFLSEHQIQFVDFRFTDFFGTWQHLTFPVDCCTEDIFTHGIGFDGSSIRGFQHINDSDMLLKPDPTSGFIDPFMQHPTAVYLCNIYDPITGQPKSSLTCRIPGGLLTINLIGSFIRVIFVF